MAIWGPHPSLSTELDKFKSDPRFSNRNGRDKKTDIKK